MKTFRLAQYEKALRVAAKEMYQNEVVDTDMVHNIIGEGNECASKEDWIEDRMEGWLREGKEEI